MHNTHKFLRFLPKRFWGHRPSEITETLTRLETMPHPASQCLTLRTHGTLACDLMARQGIYDIRPNRNSQNAKELSAMAPTSTPMSPPCVSVPHADISNFVKIFHNAHRFADIFGNAV